jgi:membrane protease YdiL (CAAX protease family)
MGGMSDDNVPAEGGVEAGTVGWWWRLLTGLAVVFILFQSAALALGSDRGQSGLLVAALVIVALVTVELVLFRRTPPEALRGLGFGRPAGAGLFAALAVCLLLLAVIPIYAALRGASLAPYPGWLWLLPGLFAQAGVAEEALFRGYLFGRLRRGRSFWRAAALATGPFVLVHLILFMTMPWPVALAAVLLSVATSFPLAYLFELGGNTIWPPALVHFTVQGAIKVVEMPGDTALPLVWMAACAAIPFLVFLARRPVPATAPA